MIYLITGVPGSGKTLYAVSTLVQKLAAEKIKDKQGNEVNRRVCVDGIPGLLMPHELMAAGPEAGLINLAGSDGRKVDPAKYEGNGLWNWFDWCQPGDVIVVDEVQRYWRPRGMGTKPPPEIAMLETHRHLGVDFVIITQNPMLIDQNVRRLVGRHQNIRRLLGMARAIIYDWDGCAADVTRTKTATSSFWNYPKSAYKLYESSQLHTKQRQKVPLWLAVPVLAVVAGLFVAPMAFGTLSGAMTGKGVSSAKAQEKKEVALLPDVTAGLPAAMAASAPQSPASEVLASTEPKEPPYAGCAASKNKCTCYDKRGFPVPVEPEVCTGLVVGSSTVPKHQIDDYVSRVQSIDKVAIDFDQAKSDASVLAYMASKKQ
jgi:zona occludens toxin